MLAAADSLMANAVAKSRRPSTPFVSGWVSERIAVERDAVVRLLGLRAELNGRLDDRQPDVVAPGALGEARSGVAVCQPEDADAQVTPRFIIMLSRR